MASFNNSHCSADATAGEPYFITSDSTKPFPNTQAYCNDRTATTYFPHSVGEKKYYAKYNLTTNFCTQNYWDVDGNKVPCAMGIYQSNRCCNGKYDCSDPSMAKSIDNNTSWCTGQNACIDPVTYDDAASWCIAHYGKPVPTCNTLLPPDKFSVEPVADSTATPPDFMCDALFVGTDGVCAVGDNIKTFDACRRYCRNPATNSQGCVNLVNAFCERHPDDELCGCVAAQRDVDKAAASGEYVDATGLVACFDSRCIADMAYKSPEQYERAVACPNVCQQVVDLTTSGAYSPIYVDNVRFSQHCTDLTQQTQLKQQQANAIHNVPPPPSASEAAAADAEAADPLKKANDDIRNTGHGSHTDPYSQDYCNDETQQGNIPTSKGTFDYAGDLKDSHNVCTQTYWDLNNRVPCALGAYTSNECCLPKMCSDPLSYNDAYLWCKAHSGEKAPMPPCNVVDPGDIQKGGKAPVRQPPPDDALSPQQLCDDLFTGDPGGICRSGDNIKLVPECLKYCMDPKTNNNACADLVQSYCARYPDDVELCGCVIGLQTFARDNPTTTGSSPIQPELLVGCFDTACVRDTAYKTPAMQTTYAQNCPNVCVEVMKATTTGAYSPLMISEPKFEQECSADYYKFQQVKLNATDNVPAPIPFYPPVEESDASAREDVRRYVGPVVIAVGVYLVAWVVGLAVAGVLRSRSRRRLIG